jgi:aspartate kinase
MISTSEIRISVVVRGVDLAEAARVVHTAYGLDNEIEATVHAGTGR